MDTKQKIMLQAKKLFASQGSQGISMRDLAESSKITLSNIYHYFPSKDKLLEEIFHTTNTALGEKRKNLPETETASDMLKQRIEFQLDNAEDIVYVLKYYLTYRENFTKSDTGFLPPKTYLHIEEVLQRGVETGEFIVDDLFEDSQVIAHCINGFVLEYFPHQLTNEEKEQIVRKIHRLLMRALTKHER